MKDSLKPWEKQFFEIMGKPVDIRHNGIWYRNVRIVDRDIKRLILFCEREDGTQFELGGGSWAIIPHTEATAPLRKTYPSKISH
jgi:hypothetical protein